MSKPTTKLMRNIGFGVSALVALVLCFSASMKIMQPAKFIDGWVHQFGFPQGAALPIGLVEILCGVLLLIPQTAMLGAILCVGYLGGATCTHVRMSDPAGVAPVILGVLAVGSVWLRDRRLRELLPLRTAE